MDIDSKAQVPILLEQATQIASEATDWTSFQQYQAVVMMAIANGIRKIASK
jgi:hypothetical protein